MKMLIRFLTVVVVLISISGAKAATVEQLAKTFPEDVQPYFMTVAHPAMVPLANDMLTKKRQQVAQGGFIHPQITLRGLGSYDSAVNEYALKRGVAIAVAVWQLGADGAKDVSPNIVENKIFSSTDEANAYLHEKATLIALQGVSTNTWINKDAPLNIFAYTTSFDQQVGWVNYLYISKPFNLIKKDDGSYEVPDLSGFKLGLVETMIFPIPKATDGRMDMYSNPVTTGRSNLTFSVTKDNGTDRSYFYFEKGHEYVSIATEVATSGTNGTVLLYTSVTVPPSEYYKFGPMGQQFPFISNFSISGSQASFAITAERGKTFMIDSAPCANEPWVEVGSVVVPSDTSTINFQSYASGPLGIYRVRSADE